MEGQSPPEVLISNKRYVFGVIAQFFNVAAQVCTWTFLIQYSQQAVNRIARAGRLPPAAEPDRVPSISRCSMTWLIGKIRATKVLTVLAVLAVVLVCSRVLAQRGRSGRRRRAVLLPVLMFPTIYGVALQGLGRATKFGAAGLVMAIVGGAIMPLIQGFPLNAPARRSPSSFPPSRRRRRPFCRLRPAGGAHHGQGASSMKRYWIILVAVVLAHAWRRAKGQLLRPANRLEVMSCGFRPPSTRLLRCWSTHSRRESRRGDRRRHHFRRWRKQVEVALAARLQAGDPRPTADIFLPAHCAPGSDRPDRHVSGVYESSGLDPTMPQALLDARLQGQGVGVPTGSHRGNVLWFSQRVLKEAGVKPPGPDYTLNDFQAHLAEVAASGKSALCLGGKVVEFDPKGVEYTLLSVVGTDGWSWIGTNSFDGAEANCGSTERHRRKSASQPIRKRPASREIRPRKSLATGECSACPMNDSVDNAELVANRAVEGKGLRLSTWRIRYLGFLPRDRGACSSYRRTPRTE